MPASRSARAMILAPRSCPSRPGLATTTRIFPATARSLRLLRVELLRAVRWKRPELGGEIGMPLEGSVDNRLHAQGLHALDLFLLESRVDAEEIDRLLVLLLVAVDADDHALAALDLGLVAEARLGDLALLEVLLDRGDHAAELLDPLEVVVRLALELVRELLEVVGAAKRV